MAPKYVRTIPMSEATSALVTVIATPASAAASVAAVNWIKIKK